MTVAEFMAFQSGGATFRARPIKESLIFGFFSCARDKAHSYGTNLCFVTQYQIELSTAGSYAPLMLETTRKVAQG